MAKLLPSNEVEAVLNSRRYGLLTTAGADQVAVSWTQTSGVSGSGPEEVSKTAGPLAGTSQTCTMGSARSRIGSFKLLTQAQKEYCVEGDTVTCWRQAAWPSVWLPSQTKNCPVGEPIVWSTHAQLLHIPPTVRLVATVYNPGEHVGESSP